MKTAFASTLFYLPLALCLAALAPAAEEAVPAPSPEASGALFFRHNAMGTYYEARIYPPQPGMLEEDLRPAVESAWEAIDTLEQQISNWKDDSSLSEVNRYAAQRPVTAAPSVVTLLMKSREINEETGGAFDPTVGPLLKLWGFYKKEGHFPSDMELQESLLKVGLQNVEVDGLKNEVRFKKTGIYLDFGGVGKGYALDLAGERLREQGITSALLHSGTSTILAIGAPPDAPGWTVRVEEPYNSSGKLLEAIKIKDEALSESSGTERFFELEGKRYIHIFDPRTGKPVEGVLASVAIAPRATQADALSTAFFVMGPEQTKAYCDKHPAVRAMLVTPGTSETETTRYNFINPREN